MEITVKKQEMKERDNLEQRKESERAEAAKLEQEIKVSLFDIINRNRTLIAFFI